MFRQINSLIKGVNAFNTDGYAQLQRAYDVKAICLTSRKKCES